MFSLRCRVPVLKRLRFDGRKPSLLVLVVLSVAVSLLSGCAAKRLKADYIGFESAFAATSNREVLLNLARLQNRDPTYFFKLGQISSNYKMQASLNGSGNYVIQGTGQGGNAIGGGAPSLVYENDPNFTFIPVNDETNAQLLLKPIPAETFYILYQQGWRLDQLFRLMVDRIELARPTRSGGCVVQTIRNVPPPTYSDARTQPDGEMLSGYVTFLRISALAYTLQKHGYLLLRGTTKFVAYDKQSGLPGNAKDKDGLISGAPKADDFAKAAATNSSWRLVNGNWTLGQQVAGAEFYLNPPPVIAGAAEAKTPPSVVEAIEDQLVLRKELEELGVGQARHEVLAGLQQGFSIDSAPATETAGGGCAPPHLIMRSLLGMMSAVAQEQTSFDALLKQDPEIPKTQFMSPDPKEGSLTFKRAVPSIEQEPALRIHWISEDKGTAPLVQVDYRGKAYLIADSSKPGPPENQYWNRDMFRLVSQLQSQVTVDISKFPLPTVLQLNTSQ